MAQRIRIRIEAYDIASNTWATRAPMPTARSGTGIAVVDGTVHVLGGEGWVDDFGGVFRVTDQLQQKHGLTRSFDTPISECGLVAAAREDELPLLALDDGGARVLAHR